jgi:hypothetical protein
MIDPSRNPHNLLGVTLPQIVVALGTRPIGLELDPLYGGHAAPEGSNA